jgi:hypothetical protein
MIEPRRAGHLADPAPLSRNLGVPTMSDALHSARLEAVGVALARLEAARAAHNDLLKQLPGDDAPSDVADRYDLETSKAWGEIINAEAGVQAAVGNLVGAVDTGDDLVAAVQIEDKLVICLPIENEHHRIWDDAANVVVIDKAKVVGLG